MFRMPRSAYCSPPRSSDAMVLQARAPESLRARVLAGVRGESGRRRVRYRMLVVPLLSLAVGVVLGATLESGRSAGTHSVARLQATLHALGSRAELAVSGMPEPPAGEVYEVWLVRAGRSSPQPTDALFTVTKAGSATVEVPDGGDRAVREVLVTSEPLGGSSVPTGRAVLRVRSPSSD